MLTRRCRFERRGGGGRGWQSVFGIVLLLLSCGVGWCHAIEARVVFDARTGPTFYDTHDVFAYVPKYPQECTLPSCLNWNRTACAVPSPRVHVYSSPDTKLAPGIYADFLQALFNLNRTTPHPEHACLFVPGFDTTLVNGISYHPIALHRLPYWHNNTGGDARLAGNHHVVLLHTDLRLDNAERMWEAAAAAEEETLASSTLLGAAMVISAGSLVQPQLRLGYDLAIPLTPLHLAFPSTLSATKDRQMFLSFRGQRYPFVAKVRNFLGCLHRPADGVYMFVTCTRKSAAKAELLWRYDAYACQTQERLATTHPFAQWNTSMFFSQSVFSLVPRGYSLETYRLVEAMTHGSIPVVLSDVTAALFAPETDDSICALHVPERLVTTKDGFAHLLQRLRRMTSAEITMRRAACRQLVATWYSLSEQRHQATLSRVGLFEYVWSMLLDRRIAKSLVPK